jgi:hypothetical protein
MHIITGLIIAGLSGKLKKNKSLGGLPRFRTGPIRVVHSLPGRIRFEVPSLRGADDAGLAWVEDFQSLEGLKRIEVSTISGSVLIVYREAEVDPQLLFGALARMLRLDSELERSPSPALMRELRDVGKSLNRSVYDGTSGMLDLWSLLVIALAVMGAKKVLQSGWASFPTGFTLLWWALNSISRRPGGVM